MVPRRTLAVGLLCAVVGVSSVAATQAGPNPDPIRASCGEENYGVVAFRRAARSAYAKERWRERDPRTGAEKRELRRMRRCARDDQVREHMRREIARIQGAFAEYRQERLKQRAERRRLLPYYFGEPTLRRVAIPPAIVYCETRGYYGASRWEAHNPSGADGPYQLLGKGVPIGADTRAERMEHHRVAANLYADGAGREHWAC